MELVAFVPPHIRIEWTLELQQYCISLQHASQYGTALVQKADEEVEPLVSSEYSPKESKGELQRAHDGELKALSFPSTNHNYFVL